MYKSQFFIPTLILIRLTQTQPEIERIMETLATSATTTKSTIITATIDTGQPSNPSSPEPITPPTPTSGTPRRTIRFFSRENLSPNETNSVTRSNRIRNLSDLNNFELINVLSSLECPLKARKCIEQVGICGEAFLSYDDLDLEQIGLRQKHIVKTCILIKQLLTENGVSDWMLCPLSKPQRAERIKSFESDPTISGLRKFKELNLHNYEMLKAESSVSPRSKEVDIHFQKIKADAAGDTKQPETPTLPKLVSNNESSIGESNVAESLKVVVVVAVNETNINLPEI